MLKLALSTHAYATESLETALKEISRFGVKGVEIWATPDMGEHLMPGKAEPKMVKSMLEELDLIPCSVAGWGGDRDLIKARMELAAAIGAKTFVRGDPREKWHSHVEFCFEVAKEFGIEIAFENHKDTPLMTDEDIKNFLAKYPDPSLGITFAPTHYYTCGFNPDEGIRLCGDRLKLIYLWDVKKDIVQGSKAPHHEDPRTQVPGSGKLDFVSIAKALDEINYTGWSCIFWHGTYNWALEDIRKLIRQGIDYVHAAWDEAGVKR